MVAFAGGRAAGGFLFTSLVPKGQRHLSAEAVIARLRPKLARVTGASLFLSPAQDLRVGGRQSNATYQYTLEAPNLTDLRRWSTKLAEALKSQPALIDVNTDQEDHGLESFVNINYDKCPGAGADQPRDRQCALRRVRPASGVDDLQGRQPVPRRHGGRPPVHARSDRPAVRLRQQRPGVGERGVGGLDDVDPVLLDDIGDRRDDLDRRDGSDRRRDDHILRPRALANSAAERPGLGRGGPGHSAGRGRRAGAGERGDRALRSPSARPPVAGPIAPPARGASQGRGGQFDPRDHRAAGVGIATWADAATPTSVNHQDTEPAATISFNLPPGKSLGEATRAITQAQAQIGMPATVHGSFQGTAKVFQDSLSSEPVLILAALVAIYMVLGILYESYIHPLTVLSTLPSAGIGAVIALIIFHIEFSIIALIGVILLIGIVKKNAILMIDFALVAEREQGLSSHDAIRQAALIRFRPIMMTTFAAILGALPLAIGWGEGAELRRPLGHHDHRRLAGQPGHHIADDAGRLSLPRSLSAPARR